MKPPHPWVFVVLQYFFTFLPLVDTLLFALQNEVNIMGVALLGPVTSSKVAAEMATILDFTQILKLSKTAEIEKL